MRKKILILCLLLMFSNFGFAQHAARVTLSGDTWLTQLGSIITIPTSPTFAGNVTVTGTFGVTSTTVLTNTLTVGTAGSGADVQFFSSTSGDHFLYDVSGERLILTGTDGQNALEVPDGDVNITDATTLTGGVLFATMSSVIWSKGGSVALATSGTDQAPTSGPRQWVEIQIPYNVTLTGIGYLVGSVGGTDSVIVELYDSAGTIAVRSVAGDNQLADLVATTAEFQKVPFTATYAAVAGTYYISVQFNGTTARLRTFPIPNSPFVANTAAGTFSTGASITPTTTFVASEGPISFVY